MAHNGNGGAKEKQEPVTTDGAICLREMCLDDLPALVAMLADPRQTRFIEWDATPESAQQLLGWAMRTAGEAPRVAYCFAIAGADDAALGVGSLVLRSSEQPEGSLGVILRPEAQGKGIAIAAMRLLIGFAFEQLRLGRVTASCSPDNTASVRLWERLGLRREAHVGQPVAQNGCWNDRSLYALLNHEWQSREKPV